VAAFDLTCTGDAGTGPTAGSGIVGSSGRVLLTGVAKVVHGRFPSVTVFGTYSLDGTYWGTAPETVESGRITVTDFEMVIG